MSDVINEKELRTGGELGEIVGVCKAAKEGEVW